MSVDRVNTLNVALVLASWGAAFFIPFELFLLSYVVLGPLHYLTQISWLHQRQYFTRTGGRSDSLFLAALAVGVSAFSLASEDLRAWNPNIAFVAFGSALIMILFKDLSAKIVGVVVLALLSMLLAKWDRFGVVFAGFLPTIIHVCVFTAAFVLVGALKGRNASGIGLLGVFTVAVVSFFVLVPDGSNYVIADFARARYDESFYGLNVSLANVFFDRPFGVYEEVFSSERGLIIARLIAFCYTYHYLNWFSKTSVIRWHDVPKNRLVACVVIWLASLGLYAWDFRVGAATLGFLSLMHVYLEFPLDHRTFITIGQETRALFRPRSV